jgi:hypothetical protein
MNTPAPVIAMDEVESSQIHSLGYDTATSTLAIRFRDRTSDAPAALYHYANVPGAEFEALRDAASIGSYFGKHIKPYDVKYPYVCIEKKPQTTTTE